MEKQARLIKDRLHRVVQEDRRPGIETLLTVLKSDISGVLSNYMSLGADALEIFLDTFENGDYEFTFKARTGRIIEAGKMIAWD